MNNREEKIKVYVMIGTIVMLLVIFSGITYAFFSASNNKGSTSVLEVKSGKMIISYADGKSSLLVSNDIVPSSKIIIDKTFTLTGTNTTSGLSMPYKVGIKYNSTFSDGMIHYYIKEINRANSSNITVNYTGDANQTVQGNPTYTGYSHGTLKNGNRYTELVTGEFPASTTSQTITFNLLMQFPDTNENQDSEKGKSINAYIEINHELNASEYIAALDKETNGLEIDDTEDKNLRYVGSTPNNYISFNNETWRIIGVFDVINADTNMKESLVKIVRNKSLGRYSWDSSDSSINNGNGINEWSQADLMTELNIDYLDTNKTSGTTTWYSGNNNTKTATYDYSNNIKSEYINKIANIRWNLGTVGSSFSVKKFYNQERETSHINNPADGVTRTDYWDGKIGLMYPSDYGYASTDTICRSQLSSYDCKNNNWLFKNCDYWLLSPTFNESIVFLSQNEGYIRGYYSFNPLFVYPSLFLSSNVQITGGTGTSTNPFVIE